MNGHLDEVKYLISKGENINAKDNYGRTPLYLAIWIEHYQVVDYLISNGADTNVKDNHNKTLLHYASKYGRL